MKIKIFKDVINVIVIGPNTMGLLMAAVADKLPELPREKVK